MKLFVSFVLGIMLFLPLVAGAQQATPNSLSVNGKVMSPSVILGSTGNDWAVSVTPILQATGARVQATSSHVEALWNDNSSLQLEVGRDTCVYKGQTLNLNTPCGSLGTDLVMPLGDLCTIIGARVEMATTGEMTIFRDVVIGNTNMATYGPASATGQRFPEAGMGGLTSRVDNAQAPYDRPEVSVSTIGTTNYTLETPRYAESIAPAVSNTATMNPMNQTNPMASRGARGVDQFGIPLEMSKGMGGYQGGSMGASINAPMGGSMGASMGSGMNSPMGASMNTPMAPPMGASGGVFAGKSGMSNMAVPNMGGMNGTSRSVVAPGMFSKSGLGNVMSMSGQGNMMQQSSSTDGVHYYQSSAPSTSVQPIYNSKGEQVFPKPAKLTITSFDVHRIMSFHLTVYEVKARIKNEGGLPTEHPIMLQLMAKSKRYDHYDLLESYLINPLQPGDEVEVVKKVDGHQFTCLVDLAVDFKVSMLEYLPVGGKKSARLRRQQARRNPNASTPEAESERSYQETSSKQKKMRY